MSSCRRLLPASVRRVASCSSARMRASALPSSGVLKWAPYSTMPPPCASTMSAWAVRSTFGCGARRRPEAARIVDEDDDVAPVDVLEEVELALGVSALQPEGVVLAREPDALEERDDDVGDGRVHEDVERLHRRGPGEARADPEHVVVVLRPVELFGLGHDAVHLPHRLPVDQEEQLRSGRHEGAGVERGVGRHVDLVVVEPRDRFVAEDALDQERLPGDFIERNREIERERAVRHARDGTGFGCAGTAAVAGGTVRCDARADALREAAGEEAPECPRALRIDALRTST